MRNSLIKIMLAVVALSSLAACGPSKEEIQRTKAIELNNAYQNMLRKSAERYGKSDGLPTKEESVQLDLEAKKASEHHSKLKKEFDAQYR